MSRAVAVKPLPRVRTPAIRRATLEDVPALVRLENLSFETDRLTRRQFRYMLTRARAQTLLAADDADRALGYVLVLFSRGTSVARL